MDSGTEETVDDIRGTIASYRPTEYQVAEWPKIDDAGVDSSFTPLVFDRISSGPYRVDPLFSDFDAMRAQENAQAAQAIPEEREDIPSDALEHENSNHPHESATEISAVEQEPTDAQDSMSAAVVEISDGCSEDGEGKEQSTTVDADVTEAGLSDEVRPAHDGGEVAALPTSVDDTQAVLIEQAVEEAYAQGREEVRAALEESKSQLEKRFDAVIEDLQLQISEGLHACERSAAELALQVARKLVGDIVQSKQEYVVQIIREAMKSIAGAEITGIRVSPQDYEYLSRHKDELQAESRGSTVWKLQSDDSIRAGCIVTTSAGEVDFDLDKAWSRISDKILKGM